jgi:hypothetical protein
MLFFTLIAVLKVTSGLPVCSVIELRNSPDYQYRAARVRQFVDSAEVIVHAKAGSEIRDGGFWSRIRFEVVERLRAPDS